MTRQEFDSWLKSHTEVFPHVMEWLANQNIDRMTDAWAKALSRTRLQDAIRCTEKMMMGDVEHPNTFETAFLPAAVCKNCPRQPIPFAQLKGRQYNAQTGEII